MPKGKGAGKTAGVEADATAKPAKPKKPRKRAKSAKEHKREIERRENMNEALDYRRQGYTYQQIAEQMDKDRSTIFRWVNEAIAEIPVEKAEIVRTMELERLDLMQQRLWEQFEEAPSGQSMNSILALMDRRARYLKLYQDEDGGADEFMAMASQRFAEMLAADKPILRPDGAIPANPVL